jgi:hypothetical protein
MIFYLRADRVCGALGMGQRRTPMGRATEYFGVHVGYEEGLQRLRHGACRQHCDVADGHCDVQ